jgi:hypothetical protein
MTFVERPVVVGGDERVVLRGHVSAGRIALDVRDRAEDVFGGIEEDFVTGTSPDGVVRWSKTALFEMVGAKRSELVDHLFRKVLMFADHEVAWSRMIAHA